MVLRLRNKELFKSVKDELPMLGELVVGYQQFKPIFAVRLALNGEPEWYEVKFIQRRRDQEVEYRLIEGDECAISEWAQIPSIVEV